MKKLIAILFTLFIGSASYAQIEDFFVADFVSPEKTSVGVFSNFDLNASSITATFSNKFITGGFIDAELKNSVLDRTKNSNCIGGNINTGLFATFGLPPVNNQKDLVLFFSVRDRAHFDMGFSKDLFTLGFYGNADHAGETADLSNFGLNYIRYQQVQVGMFSTRIDSVARWGIGLSFIKGEEYLSILTSRADLFTSMDGQLITLDTEIQTVQSDTAQKGFGAFNGYGASLDLFFEAPFDTKMGKSKIKVSVSDIGSIYFNNKTIVRSQDSSFSYSGFEINGIYDLKDSTLGSRIKDSLLETIIPHKKHSYAVTLPAVLDLSFGTALSDKIHIQEGIKYIFNANYKLLFYVKGKFFITPKLLLSTTFAHGGYGNFNYGFGVSALLGERFIIYAGSNNIEGFIAPKKTGGQAAYLTLIKKFK